MASGLCIPNCPEGAITACASAVWPTVQDHIHYTQPAIEELTDEDSEPKAKSAASAGWAAFSFLFDKW